MKNLILIGGGGHCKSVIEAVESTREYEIVGILERNIEESIKVLGYPVIGSDDLIPELVNAGNEFLITVGQLKDNSIRLSIYENLIKLGAKLATVIASSAVVSKHARVSDGSVVMHQCVVNAGVVVGENAILNTASVLEHDTQVGNHCHISTKAIVNADCIIADHCFIGSNTVINRGLVVGEGSIITSASLVTKNLTGNKRYQGIPVSGS